MATVLKDGQTVLFIGDSITDCGRRDDSARPYGRGYVSIFRDIMLVREPQKNIGIINRGIGGETVVELRNRWDNDVISHHPDWLSVKIGINDLHRHIAENDNGLLSTEGFFKIYDQLLSSTVKKLPGCKMILIDPFYISRADEMGDSFRMKVLKILPEYIDAVSTLSKKYRALHVQTHELFQKLLKYQHPDSYCNEPVHPFSAGHLMMAEEIYKALSK
ncbi:MAG: GDSL-type esterase/lipase family protein [Victivallales bacterium]